ncbi:MAG TPA: sigma-70 family RNA polymerase sigma factor [Solirubrobacteraceae bacterium]|jgi:RNA polymerase sigma factor (sigma-70 family)|nr:sigma-70 family RNA polymerase sigma factor [Solirubrobacteraceae bacterium]
MADRDGHERAGLRGGSRARLRFAADDRLVALVRRGDATAFEVLYDRHAGELLSFCGYLLGSRADAEDAIQSTFASAHTALLADDRPIDARPWLFTIARNACLSILRTRRPIAEVSLQTARDEHDPVARAEQREDMRRLLATLGELPERQRVALVLRELHGFSHSEIATLLGVRAAQVKSYVYQARSNVISERDARDADCRAIRHQLANARGPALLEGQLRRHLRSCPDCRAYAARLSRQRRQLGILLPFTPSVALKRRALHAALGSAPHAGTHTGGVAAGGAATGGAATGGVATGGGAATGGVATGGAAAGGTATGVSFAATGAELVGGGAKALIAKLLVGVACLGAGSSAASLVGGVPVAPVRRLAATSQPGLVTRQAPSAPSARGPVAAPALSIRSAAPRSAPGAGQNVTAVSTAARHLASQPPATAVVHASQTAHVDTAIDPAASSARATGVPASGGGETHGKSEQAHGESEERAEAHGGSEEAHGKSEEAHGISEAGEQTHGKSEEPHGNSEAANGNSEEAHGKSGAGEEPHGKSGTAEEPHGNSEQAHGKGAN